MLQDTISQLVSSFDPTDILVRIVASIIGLIYLAYGKKQNFWYALCGLGSLLYPYFIHTSLQLVSIGAGLLVAPMILSRLIR